MAQKLHKVRTTLLVKFHDGSFLHDFKYKLKFIIYSVLSDNLEKIFDADCCQSKFKISQSYDLYFTFY